MKVIFRPIQAKDFEGYAKLAFASSIGITNLPKDLHQLKERFEQGLHSFETRSVSAPRSIYLFVIEDVEKQEIGGTCCLVNEGQVKYPRYYYSIETEQRLFLSLKKMREETILCPIARQNMESVELCGLYLSKNFRHSGYGKLLSLSRLLYIKVFQEQFYPKIFSELQGVIDSNQECPFWNGISRHFFNMSFAEAMEWKRTAAPYLSDILPQWPIYLSLLPLEVQQVVAKVHSDTIPAYHLLGKIGLTFHGEVDIFDGGPKLEGEIAQLDFLKKCKLASVKKILKTVSESTCLVSNCREDFITTYGDVELIASDEVAVTEELAADLKLEIDEKICFYKV